MSLAYPASAIPPADRCPECNGSGDEWTQVYDAKYGTYQMEPVDECPDCGGTGLASGNAERAFTAYRSALASRCLFPRVVR